MTAALIGALVLVAVLLVIVPMAKTKLSDAKDWAELFQALLTCFAIGVAALWYFVERRALPHADISQSVEIVPVEDGLIAIEAHVTIKNIGRTLLKINRIESRLQAVSADAYRYDKLVDRDNQPYWVAARPGTKPKEAQFHFAELRWPMLRHYARGVDHKIEAGESDIFIATFLMRCPKYRFVRVATDVYNPDAGKTDLAWKARNFADIGAFCTDKTGGDDGS